MSSYLFLDIDGVLNTYHNPTIFQSKSITLLNKIINETNCEIIVSSDWRRSHTLHELSLVFEINGIIKKPIAKTGIISHTDYSIARGLEILNLVSTLGIKKFAILDDMNIYLPDDKCSYYSEMLNMIKYLDHNDKTTNIIKNNFFRVNEFFGFVDENKANNIISHLNS